MGVVTLLTYLLVGSSKCLHLEHMVIGDKYLSQGVARRFRRYGFREGEKDINDNKVHVLQR